MRDVFPYLILFLILSLAISAVLFYIFRSRTPLPSDDPRRTLTIKGIVLQVDVADTAAKQAQGLSGREPLRDDEGMLFIFGAVGRHPFWMKDMKFAIDIIWIGEDKVVVDITKNAQPSSFPWVFKPKAPAQYVLEVNAGWSDYKNIEIGDIVEF